MPKIRKQQRRKVYRYGMNRKRLRDKINKLPAIPCVKIKKSWEKGKSVAINLSNMGLASDPNTALKIPTIKTLMQPLDPGSVQVNMPTVIVPPKHKDVAEALETEAKQPRARTLKLPSGQVEWLSYLIKRYKSDFKAMSRDPKNVNQETAKQIRAKIKLFKTNINN